MERKRERRGKKTLSALYDAIDLLYQMKRKKSTLIRNKNNNNNDKRRQEVASFSNKFQSLTIDELKQNAS